MQSSGIHCIVLYDTHDTLTNRFIVDQLGQMRDDKQEVEQWEIW